ncbi:putative transmembrane protein [Heterostelium album PN500]|uniref:Putative transmembrane protein n=1 Tax=Heterostelium pallidum (strain ATCC 26659 / Pp 5 / PN500) TaxID=670386 RepID=D3BAP8_HETP5|nr:putative transmembrane protein [Heterostelium album PN500]EFA81635.1 putative transmembrane protein [Heterostelium album PN500]|eukprot:XP_020433752.1 putative transmembrane protein [Heterostelium album PN500]
MSNNSQVPTKVQYEEQPKPPFYANLIAGGIAGIIGATTIFPIDMIKTRLQNQKVLPNGQRTYNGALDCARKIIANEGGVRALYRGLSANLVGITPEKALKLAVNDQLRQILQGDAKTITIGQEVLAGAGAGFCQVIATNPMEIVKIRMQISGEGGAKASLREVVSELGLRGLYKGTAATLLRDVPFSMVYFSMYARIKGYFTDKQTGHISLGHILLSGIIAGSFAASFSTPMDVIKTRIQVKPKPGDPTYNGIIDCVQKTLKNEGPKAFTKGLVPRIMIISPLFGITLVVYEIQKKIFAYTHNKNKQ